MSEFNAVIYDLDNTIFPANSISSDIVKPVLDTIVASNNDYLPTNVLGNALKDCYFLSISDVAKKYHFPPKMLNETLESFNKITIDYPLETYEDYNFINLHCKTKFLVTSGQTYFQNIKIENLGIKNDFIEIFIHDDGESSYTGKLTIFKNILDKYELSSNQVLVVGDNPASEIAAGKALNMKTVQILRDGVIKTDDADFYIHSFSELKDL